ncbi:carbohydrate kinase family protein [Gordonia sp. CPCC 205333]|uniref:carbohydrate kinase family protein n=1 Tax=Gordonia sp. CPCC 205333 TaxID=3140790 RepID=UPI003AF38CA2
MAMTQDNMAQKIMCLGAHVFDVQVYPVDSIPEGQGAALVQAIKFSPAGAAGGTAVTAAKLGAQVSAAGAIGTDAIGDQFLTMLTRYGIDVTALQRHDAHQTSASVLPIRSDGSRPALHIPGANLAITLTDELIAAASHHTHLHVGAPELLGGQSYSTILRAARHRGTVTSADILASGDPGTLEWIAPALPHLDYLLPNADQVLGLTGAATIEDGCRQLIDRGVGAVVATLGADGAIIVTDTEIVRAPAFSIDVIDTTGCGDAFSAGFLRGIGIGRSTLEAAVLGNATAAQVAGGLGSDHGDFDLESVDAFAANHEPLLR